MTLVSANGWEAILQDTTICWSVDSNESLFQGDISVKKTKGKGGDLFGLRCFGQRVRWELEDGSDEKIVDDNLLSLWIPLPTTCAAPWVVLSRKVRGRTSRAVCHRINFPPNEGSIESTKVMVEVFDRDTTPSDYSDAALMFASLETHAETVGKGPEFQEHQKYCECKLCVRQAFRKSEVRVLNCSITVND